MINKVLALLLVHQSNINAFSTFVINKSYQKSEDETLYFQLPFFN